MEVRLGSVVHYQRLAVFVDHFGVAEPTFELGPLRGMFLGRRLQWGVVVSFDTLQKLAYT